MAQSHTVTNRNGRRTAEVTDDFELLPPRTAVKGRVPEHVVDAVDRALEAKPNTVNDPELVTKSDRLVFDCTFNELPAIGPDGGARGWLHRYRAQEEFLEALEVDGYDVEIKNISKLEFYPEEDDR